MNQNVMQLPSAYGFVSTVSQLLAGVSVLFGVAMIVLGVGLFSTLGAPVGLMVVFGGGLVIVVAITTYGVIQCFLASVKAQIDTRNIAAIRYCTDFPQEGETGVSLADVVTASPKSANAASDGIEW